MEVTLKPIHSCIDPLTSCRLHVTEILRLFNVLLPEGKRDEATPQENHAQLDMRDRPESLSAQFSLDYSIPPSLSSDVGGS